MCQPLAILAVTANSPLRLSDAGRKTAETLTTDFGFGAPPESPSKELRSGRDCPCAQTCETSAHPDTTSVKTAATITRKGLRMCDLLSLSGCQTRSKPRF